MDAKTGLRDAYDSIADVWREKNWVQDKDFQKTIKDFSPFLPSDDLLDVGTGNGDFASIFDVKSVTAIDNSKAMLEKGRELYPNFNFIEADAENLPFEDGTFSAVSCRNLLQNFEDPSNAFSEMVRVLKSDGRIFVVESAVNDDEVMHPTNFCRLVEPYCPTFISHQVIRKLFDQENLKNIKQIIVSHRSRWFLNWLKSKGSQREDLKEAAYKVLLDYPNDYKKKYEFKFFPEGSEVESIRTFSFIKANK